MYKHIISTFCFHVFFALLFSVIYYQVGESGFELTASSTKNKRRAGFMDYLALSTSIQAGVGISNLSPNTELSSLLLTIQQFFLIAANVFVVYVLFKS
jgi:hypothetical protein